MSANYKKAVIIWRGDLIIPSLPWTNTLCTVGLTCCQFHHNLRGLRHLYDTVEAHVRGVRALGVTADSYGGLLTSILLSKLPTVDHQQELSPKRNGMCGNSWRSLTKKLMLGNNPPLHGALILVPSLRSNSQGENPLLLASWLLTLDPFAVFFVNRVTPKEKPH